MKQFESLIKWLEILVSCVQKSPEYKQHYLDQAFGAIQFAMFLVPEHEKEFFDLWNEYKEIFAKCEKLS